MSELAKLSEKALENYLKGRLNPDGSVVWPVTMQRGAGDNFALRIFPGETNQIKDGQCIFCAAERDFPEHIPSSGIYEVPCRVVLRTPTRALTPNDKSPAVAAPNPLATHSQAADQMQLALMANGLELSLTTVWDNSGQGLTVWGILERMPGREQEDDYWESSISMKLVCCPATFSN